MLTKEKIDRQLDGQSGDITLFTKVGDVHHSNRKTISFSTQHLVREQLDNLTSMEGNNRSFKPQIHQKRKGGKN